MCTDLQSPNISLRAISKISVWQVLRKNKSIGISRATELANLAQCKLVFGVQLQSPFMSESVVQDQFYVSLFEYL